MIKTDKKKYKMSADIQAEMISITKKKSPGQDGFIGEFYQSIKG